MMQTNDAMANARVIAVLHELQWCKNLLTSSDFKSFEFAAAALL